MNGRWTRVNTYTTQLNADKLSFIYWTAAKQNAMVLFPPGARKDSPAQPYHVRASLSLERTSALKLYLIWIFTLYTNYMALWPAVKRRLAHHLKRLNPQPMRCLQWPNNAINQLMSIISVVPHSTHEQHSDTTPNARALTQNRSRTKTRESRIQKSISADRKHLWKLDSQTRHERSCGQPTCIINKSARVRRQKRRLCPNHKNTINGLYKNGGEQGEMKESCLQHCLNGTPQTASAENGVRSRQAAICCARCVPELAAAFLIKAFTYELIQST